MTKDISYAMYTNHIHIQLLQEDLTRTGLYQWMNVFKGKIHRFQDAKPEDICKHDIIQVNASRQDLNLIPRLRKIIDDNNAKTKLVVNNDYTTELWFGSFDYPEEVGEAMRHAHMLFGTEYYMCTAVEEITGRKCYEIPHPCHVKRLKILPKEPKQEVIGILWHRYDNPVYIPWFMARNHGLKTRLLGYTRDVDKKPYVAESMYNEILPGKNFPEFCRDMLRCRVLVEPFTLHSHGRCTLDTAALGIPVVGSDRVESVRRCYPHTTIDPYDIKKGRELINKLLTDDEFYDKVSSTAQKEVEYYNQENAKKRYLKALKEETDVDFLDEPKEEVVQK